MKKKSKADQYNWCKTGSYTYQKPFPRKDNITIYGTELHSNGYMNKPISESGQIEYWRGLRVPSLKRKSAWKRFYRLFPGLKGKKIIHGSSQPIHAYGVNASTIKLKISKKCLKTLLHVIL